MSPLLIALLGVMLIPLFVATWRTSLAGLAAQGFLMAWIAYRSGPVHSIGDWLTLADLVLVRGFWAPLALYTVLRARKTPARNDVIPPNLLSWTVALGIVLVAFNFSEVLVTEGGQEQTLVAVATTGFLLGFLVLATQSAPFSQMIGAVRIENAIALFELGGARHHQALGLRIGQMLVMIVTIGLYRWYLSMLSTTRAPTTNTIIVGSSPDIATAPEEPTL